MNKRTVIEGILRKHKGAISSEDALTEANAAGIESTVNYVRLVRAELTGSGVLPRMRKKKEHPPVEKPRRKHGQQLPAVENSSFTISDLQAVKSLSARFGGGLDALPGKVAAALAQIKELAS